MSNLDDYRGRLLARAFHDELEKIAFKPSTAPAQLPDATIPKLKRSGGGPAGMPTSPKPTLGGAGAKATTTKAAPVKPVQTVPTSGS